MSSTSMSRRSMSPRPRAGSSSQPSHFASFLAVQTVGSRDQIRSTSSRRSVVTSRRGESAALGADVVDQLVERSGELAHAFDLECLDNLVVVNAGVAEL